MTVNPTSSDAPIPLPTDRHSPLELPAELQWLCVERPIAPLAFPDGPSGWLVTSYDLVRAGLGDPRLGSRRPHANSHLRENLISAEEMAALRPTDLLTTDPPEHTRLRRPLNSQFSVRRTNRLAPRIQAIVDHHLDVMATASRPVDLVQAVALPVPTLVISELLGVPYADRDLYHRLIRELLSLERTREELLASKKAMKDYLLSLVHLKRANPTDDLLSDLVQGQTDDEP